MCYKHLLNKNMVHIWSLGHQECIKITMGEYFLQRNVRFTQPFLNQSREKKGNETSMTE